MKKIIVGLVGLFSVMLIVGCSRDLSPEIDKSVITGEEIVDLPSTDIVLQTGEESGVVVTTGMSGNDMVISTGVFVRRQSEFCKDPTLGWNCDMDDIYFQEKGVDGNIFEFPIGCYSGTVDKIVYKSNENWTIFNTVAIQFEKEYVVKRNKETIWEQRHMDAPDHRPGVCIIPFATFQILSKGAN